ncbi:MMPL family transporter [Luteococcus peritonei]|uniref:MMPL family transporter n=1 Tax=Luteococcus peritonei TaxID=88874 RepID=A0ABW4RT56_9ACTN
MSTPAPTTETAAVEQSWWRRNLRPLLSLLLLLLSLAMLGLVPEAEHARRGTDSLPEGSQSAELVRLQEQLPDRNTSQAIVLFASEDKLSPQEIGLLQRKAAELSGSAKAPAIPSQDGTAVFVPITVQGVGANQLEGGVTDLRTRSAEGLPEGVTAQVTGPAAIQTDLGAVFDGANFRLLGTTALVVAVLLVFTYRSPVLWTIPLLVVGIADRLAAVGATHVLDALGMAWDESTTGILSVLVFGAGTNYALLLISRYRDELRNHADRHEAMRVANVRSIEPVLASASTVFVGLMTLVLSAFPSTRGLGVACAVGVLIACFFVLVVLPGALVAFPRKIFWPREPVVGETSAAEDPRSLWARIGRRVDQRPALVAVAAALLLALGALGLLQTRTGLSDADQFLKKPEAIVAAERLARSFPAGAANPVVIGTRADQAQKVADAVEQVPGVSSVQRTAQGNDVAELQAITEAAPGSEEAADQVRAIRAAVADLPGSQVGGTEAQRLDKAEGNRHDQRLIFPIVLGLVFLALVGLFRSLVAPLVLVGTVLLTYVAAMGISWWVFTGLLGFERIDGLVPLYAFVFLVALGVDYNIFLSTRAKEEAVVHGTRRGILRALTATGGVITSAGILLASVFAVLGVLPLVVLAQVGVVIFIGVLLDTLVVRTVLVPALAILLGERFWWPRRVFQGAGDGAVDGAAAGAVERGAEAPQHVRPEPVVGQAPAAELEASGDPEPPVRPRRAR